MDCIWSSCRTLLKIWANNKPDIVYVATEGPLGVSAINLARKMKIAVTVSILISINICVTIAYHSCPN